MLVNTRTTSSGNSPLLTGQRTVPHLSTTSSYSYYPTSAYTVYSSFASPLRTALVMLALACFLGLWAQTADASHFAYGTISWTRPSTANRNVVFNIDMAFRHAFFGNPAIGTAPSVGSLYVPLTSTTWGYFDVKLTVKSIHTQDDPDWFLGWSSITYNVPASVGDVFTVYFQNCCRLSGILETNNDQDVRVNSVVSMALRNRSPITTGLPREYFLVNSAAGYVIPAVSPDGYALTYSLSTTAESRLPVVAPCSKTSVTSNFNTCTGKFAVEASTGVVTWTPQRTGVYAVQLRISDGAAAVYLDFLIQVMTVCPACNKAPVFDPAPPPSVSLYSGVEYTLDITASDPDPSDSVSIINTVLPDYCTFLQVRAGNPTTWRLRWTPTIDQISSVVCFKARDSRGMYSFNNNCVNLNIRMSDYMFVSGIIRNFQSNNHPDFNKPATNSTNLVPNFVQESLGPDDKPVLDTRAVGTTGITQGSFFTWFNDDAAVNKPLLYTIALTQGANTHSSRRVFSFNDNSFLPINGQLWSTNPGVNNLPFTYEIHTYVEYLGGETYTFTSSDDMWVFIDNRLPTTAANWPMAGVHGARSYALVMDSIALSHGLKRGNNYKVDIFYAHRQLGTPVLGMELSNSSICNAITLLNQNANLATAATVFDWTTIPTSTATFAQRFAVFGKAAQKATAPPSIRVMDGASASESGSVWAAVDGVATPYKVLNGFQATFTFNVAKASGFNSAEGFAFVIQSQSPTARGTEGGNLGYSGITNSLAIEFDMTQTNGKNDPAFQHISLHTNFAGANDALESPLYYPVGSSYVGNLPNLPFTFDNATDHNVRIEFTPGPQTSWMRVFVNTNIRPLYEAQLDSVKLSAAFGGGSAYVGFTSSSSDTARANVDIKAWSLIIVPALASQTTLISSPVSSAAGTTASVTVQLRDACRNALSVGGEASKFAATLRSAHLGAGTESTYPVTITDVGSGQYRFSYAPTRAGKYNLAITYTTLPGIPEAISGSPWTTVVVSGPTSAAQSYYEYGLMPVRFSNAREAFGLDCISVTPSGSLYMSPTYDSTQFTFPLPHSNSSLPTFEQWFGDLPINTHIACAVTNYITATPSTQIAGLDSMSVRLGFSLTGYQPSWSVAVISRKTGAATGIMLASKIVQDDFTPRVSYTVAGTSSFQGYTIVAESAAQVYDGRSYLQVIPAQFRVSAGATGIFGIVSKDQFGNLQTNGETQSFGFQFTPTVTGTTGPSAVSNGYFSGTFTSPTTGIFSLAVTYGGQPVGASTNVYILSGPASAANSVAFGVPSTVVAGTTSTFQLQLRDSSNNLVIIESGTDTITSVLRPTGLTTPSAADVPITAMWNANNRAYDMSFTPTKSGTYNPIITINSGAHTSSASLAVVVQAANVVASKCIAYGGKGATDLAAPPSTTGQVRTMQRIYIQARDNFGNNRVVVNNLGAGNTAQTFKANFAPQVMGSAGSLASTLEAVYEDAGRYYIDFFPTKSGVGLPTTVTVYLTDAASTVVLPSGAAATYSVVATAGPLSHTYSSVAVQGGVTSVAAGSPLTFKVTMRDEFDNPRLTSDLTDSTLATYSTASQSQGAITYGTCTTAGVCDLVASAQVSGEYSLAVMSAVTPGQPSLQGSPITVTVGPSTTVASKCEVSGNFVGEANEVRTVTIVAKDTYGNVVTKNTDTFRCDIATNEITPVIYTSSPVAGQLGTYTCTYNIPPQPANKLYTISVYYTTGGANTPVTVITSVARTPSGTCYAVLTNTLTPVSAGLSLAFEIQDREQGGNPRTDSLTLNIKVEVKATGGGSVLQSQTISVLASQADASRYSGSVLITTVGDITLSVLLGSTPCAGGATYTTTSSAGPFSAGASTLKAAWDSSSRPAGSPSTWRVIPRDQYGNAIRTTAQPAVITVDTVPPTSVTWDAPNFEYAFSYTSMKPGSQTVSMKQGTATVTLRSYVLNYVAAVANAPASKLSGVTGSPNAGFTTVSAYAGKPLTVYLFVYDEHGNTVTQTNPNAFTLVTGDATNPTVTAALVSGSPNQVAFTFTPQSAPLAGLKMSATLAGVKVNGGVDYVVSTRSGDPNRANSALTGSFTTTIDTDSVFTLTVKDVYNNPWATSRGTGAADADAAKIFVQVTSDLGAVSAGTVVPHANGNPGVFTVTLNKANYKKVGGYTISIIADGVSLSTNPDISRLMVSAGATVADMTVVPKLGSVYANAESSFVILLRDAQGNYRNSSEEDVKVRFTKGKIICPDHEHAEGSGHDDAVVPPWDSYELAAIRLYRGNGKPSYELTSVLDEDTQAQIPINGYRVYFTAEEAGVFTMNVTVNSKNMACDLVQTYLLSAEPGEPNAHATSYVFQGLPVGVDPMAPVGVAGTAYTMLVQLKDIFSQSLTRGKVPLYVGEPAQGVTPSADWLVAGPDVQDISVVDHDTAYGALTGQLTISFTPRKAKNYTLWFTLGTSKERISPNGPAWFHVRHAPARQLNPVQWSSQAITAGQSVTMKFTALDAFGNDVLTTDEHSISVQVTRTSSTLTSPTVALDVLRLNPSVVTGANPGEYQATFVPVWEGLYKATVQLRSKNGLILFAERSDTLTVSHAACGATDPTKPYRCPNGICVASYAECSGAPAACAAATPVRCATNNACVASIYDCPCSVPTDERCPTGNCMPRGSGGESRCVKAAQCPAGMVACTLPDSSLGAAGRPTGECRKSLNDCPKPGVCPTGYAVCDDGQSCARTAAECSVTTRTTCPIASQHRCSDGRCVSFVEDCPTPVSCPLNKVLCLTDYSCKDSADQCLAPSTCAIAPNTFRCPNGDCRPSADDCPSLITCPTGWVQCEDKACAPTVDECLAPITCSAKQIRCPDGSCAENALLCSQQISCPASAPVLCSDRSCKASIALCSQPNRCPVGTQVCPDGSCSSGTSCPVGKACPAATPVLCADRSCVAKESDCVTNPSCTPALPLRCPDGSCRASITDCPSRTLCPAKSPVRCPDDTCQPTLEQCSHVASSGSPGSSSTCPAGTVPCVSGECAVNELLCPTHVTCPLGTIKCNDGRCAKEADCPSRDNIDSCSTLGLIQCPLSGAGVACSASLAECPLGIVCPSNAPVRCLDSTCAVSLSKCPPPPTDTPSSTRKPCPDGSWTVDTCPSAVSCPPATPYKCYDQSCRKLVSDCPAPAQCPTATPYRCSNGVCETRPWECGAPVDGVCSPASATPVKCPLVNGESVCAANSTACPSAFAADPSGERQYCPTGFTRCRDGSCKSTAAACPALTCPPSLPHLCPNGACVKNAETDCMLDNGCLPAEPIKCIGEGSCKARLGMCPRSTCSSRGLQACADGSCSTACSRSASGCPLGKVRCYDGTCVSEYAVCTARDNKANSCPGNRPVRCPHGLCVEALSSCPVLNNTLCTDVTKPVLCADGACRASTEQCKLILPCDGEQMVRCDDGTCMDASLDANVCSMLSTCPAATPVRCKQANLPSIPIIDGLCAPSLDSCIAANGCPLVNFQPQTRCANGRCVTDASLCSTNTLLANGCDSSKPVKCWNGECAATSSACPASNGCPAATPYRCVSGACKGDPSECTGEAATACSKVVCADGSCVDNAGQCNTLVGCPVSTPVRCADGSCKKYAATAVGPGASTTVLSEACSAVISCPSPAFTLCQSGTCARSAADCPAVKYPCAAGTPILCADGVTCVASSASCPAKCPSSTPVLCPDGACVGSLSDCSLATNPQASAANGPASRPSCAGKPFTCFDGTCVTSLSECVVWANLLGRVEGPNCPTLCPDGSCIPSSSAADCPKLPACLVGSWRCGSGACQSTPCTSAAPCNAFHERCADGLCRRFGKCPPFDGCGISSGLSYQCPNRECAANAESCSAAAAVDLDAWSLERIKDGEAARKLRESMSAAMTMTMTMTMTMLGNETAVADTTSSSSSSSSSSSMSWLATTAISFAHGMKKALGFQRPTATATATATASTSAAATTATDATSMQVTALPNPNYTPCVTNCYSSYKVNLTSFVYNQAASPYQETLIAPLATEFKMRVYSGLQHDPSKDTSFYIYPVPESVMFNVTNKVHESRVGGNEGYPMMLTFAQTVLSPAMSCAVGAGVPQPFNQPVYIQSNVDLSANPSYEDICLARLRRFPDKNYNVWTCLLSDVERKTPAGSVKPDPTVRPSLVSGTINTCVDSDMAGQPAIYAFIHQPLPARQMYSRSSNTFWRDNVVYIMLGATGVLLVICALTYCCHRLTRYKGKEEEINKEVKELENIVADMEQFGGTAGARDEEIAVTSNPLAIQLADLRQHADPNKQKRAEELRAQQEAQSAERQTVINELAQAREREIQALEALRAQTLAGAAGGSAPNLSLAPARTPAAPLTARPPAAPMPVSAAGTSSPMPVLVAQGSRAGGLRAPMPAPAPSPPPVAPVAAMTPIVPPSALATPVAPVAPASPVGARPLPLPPMALPAAPATAAPSAAPFSPVAPPPRRPSIVEAIAPVPPAAPGPAGGGGGGAIVRTPAPPPAAPAPKPKKREL